MKQSITPKSPLLIVAIQLGLLLLAIYYTFIGGQTAQVIYDHHWRLITLWLTTTIILSWLVWRLFSRHKIPRTPLDWPLFYLLNSLIVATLFSVNSSYSRETIVFFVFYLFFFYIAVDLGRWPWFVELTFNALIAVAGLVWLLALFQLSNWYQDQVSVPILLQGSPAQALRLPRLSVLGNPNTMASYIALVLPLVLYKLTVAHKTLTRSLLLIWIVMLFGSAFLTQSRGGLLGLIVAVGFYLILFLRIKVAPEQSTERKQNFIVRHRQWISALIVVGGAVFFIWFTFSFRGFYQGVSIRQTVMIGAVKTLAANPLTGAGPGALGQELIRYQAQTGIIWPDAHNLFLTFIAETGLIGAVGLVWLGLVAFKTLLNDQILGQRSRWSLNSLTCAAALAGFVVHNMVDSQLKFPLIMLMVAILAGFWLSLSLPLSSANSSSAKVFSPAIMMGAGVVVLANAAIGMTGIKHLGAYNQGVAAADSSNWQTTVNYLQTAYQLAPQSPFYQRQLGFATGYLAETDPALNAEAISHYKAALNTVDKLPVDHANLGCLLWNNNRRTEAIREMTLAAHLQPGNLLYHLNLGYYLEQNGNIQAAQDEYAYVLAARPDYLPSSYWHQDEERALALTNIVELAHQNLVANNNILQLVDLHLQADNVEQAWQMYDDYAQSHVSDSINHHLAKGYILFATGQFDKAKLEFESVVQTASHTAGAYLYLSKIALLENNLVEATQTIEAALYLGPNAKTLYQTGRVAEANGDKTFALQYYEQAFAELTTDASRPELFRYATETARRRPLPAIYLPCLMRIYPTRLLINITQAEGNLLEALGKFEAADQVYQRLLNFEPDVELSLAGD